jgi:hypothetical protein
LWARLEKLLRELNVPLLVGLGTDNKIKSVASDTLIYLVKICLRGQRFTKEPMVLENIRIKRETIRDAEETMEDGAGPDWFYMTLREDLCDGKSWDTYIEGKVKRKEEDAFDGLLEAVEEQIIEWEATDNKSGPLEAHLQSLFRGFVPPVSWSEDETVEASKTLATYLNEASQRILRRIRRPVVLEEIRFLYQKTDHGNEGERKEHYELKLFEALPSPGKKEILKLGARCLSKEEALAGFMKAVRESLEEWKTLGPDERVPSASSDKKGEGPAE